jgi:flagellar basal-body rod modification protein FlgD
MSTIASTLPTATSSTSSATSSNANGWASLQPSDFIQMMVTQLQNQDPTQPTSNEEILQQISQIGQLQSADTLQTDLSQMVLQNSISSAGNLIGKTVQGVDSSGATSSGIVNSVQVQNGTVSLQLDSGKQMQLSNVQSIAQAAASTSTTGSATSTSGTTTGTTTGATSSTTTGT